MNRILNISIWVLAISILIVLLAFTEKSNEAVPFKELIVNVNTSEGNYFISKEEIEEDVFATGYQLEYSKMGEIDINELESYLDGNPSIEKAQVYASLDGKLTVDIEQRKPILRVFNDIGESFYIDEHGWLMPLSNSYSSRVMMANGNINVSYNLNYQKNIADQEKLDQNIPGQYELNVLYRLAKRINRSDFWDAQINQIYWNKDGDIELIPRVGNHKIIIGDGSKLDEKLTKLLAFYKEGLNKTGWNDYEVINLKFKNQVVCTKK